jgi:hypothetical protein
VDGKIREGSGNILSSADPLNVKAQLQVLLVYSLVHREPRPLLLTPTHQVHRHRYQVTISGNKLCNAAERKCLHSHAHVLFFPTSIARCHGISWHLCILCADHVYSTASTHADCSTDLLCKTLTWLSWLAWYSGRSPIRNRYLDIDFWRTPSLLRAVSTNKLRLRTYSTCTAI